MRPSSPTRIPGGAMTPWQKEMLQREIDRAEVVELEHPVPADTDHETITFDTNYRVVGGLGTSWNSGWYWTARSAGTISVIYANPPAVPGILHLLLQRDR